MQATVSTKESEEVNAKKSIPHQYAIASVASVTNRPVWRSV